MSRKAINGDDLTFELSGNAGIEEKRFFDWLEDAKTNRGLQDYGFTLSDECIPESREEFFRELNEWNSQADKAERITYL